jgi:hypothetical protein
VMTNEKDLAGADAAEGDRGMATSADPSAIARHTPGPWAWFGNTKNHEIHLATERGGRVFVMTFARYGMASAQPRFQVDHRMVNAHDLVKYERDYRADIADINHPDAHLIAAAPDYHEAVADALTPNDGYNCEYVTIPRKAWQKILAAHAKAEGR